MFEMISNTDANFLNLHIDKATKTSGDKQLYLITHFTKQTLNLNYLLLMLNVTEQFGIALATHFSSSSLVLGGLNLHSAICFAKQRVSSELTNS